ncbi:acetylglutamate kinase [Breznakia sp. PF5-3]|uniref:acetylglutamate kinase n=1 Tax=unclassified Breznakia TaxID=2623764 RepID=UPI0024065822|nr:MULTISPECIES: acetylglutamate kinase [unclassified Breznakia]MDF9825570.1 acetylglutamate kinase [Breznakia sp. PM6-1]MDF9835877.1 acetylglutamate kinase [Breznakia sp. PF5-3]MDF9837622.1 acetylglutamate kinase [Breznakia sp. PFB2-8]MDF9859997.1 acetylglutamate kinase [Breznakia sp. PH5-24]
MMKDAIKEAEILSQALPYIQKYSNKIIVVKYGGNAMKNEELKQNVMTDIVLLSEIGIRVVLVHGGGPAINIMLDKVGIEPKFIDGLRYTGKETMDVVQMVLTGQVNKELVSILNGKGAKAVGVSGTDANLILAKKHHTPQDLGFVGEVESIQSDLIYDLLDQGYIPVIASVGCDSEGQAYNINADIAASSIAQKLEAENMVLVSDVPGILKDPKDETSLYSKIYYDQIDELIQSDYISGGMIPKVNCIKTALSGGVKKSCIIDGRIPHSLLIEILSKQGIGTLFRERKKYE